MAFLLYFLVNLDFWRDVMADDRSDLPEEDSDLKSLAQTHPGKNGSRGGTLVFRRLTKSLLALLGRILVLLRKQPHLINDEEAGEDLETIAEIARALANVILGKRKPNEPTWPPSRSR